MHPRVELSVELGTYACTYLLQKQCHCKHKPHSIILLLLRLLLVALVITVPLLVGAWAFGLLLVEDMLPDVSEWAFTAFSIAVVSYY